MAPGRYSRIDGHNSSNYCSIITMVVIISTCLIGAWMTMSSSIGPARTEITLEMFMGGMPKTASGSESYLPEDSLKVNISRGNPQDDSRNEIVSANESQSVDTIENHRTESKEKNEVEDEKDQNAHKVAEEMVSGDKAEKKRAQARNGVADSTKNHGGLEESPDEMKQVGERATTVEEPRVYEDKIPTDSEEIDAMKVHGEVVNQSEKADQEKMKGSKLDFHSRPPESWYKKQISNKTFAQVVPLPTQSAESEKENLVKRISQSKHQSDYSWKVCNVTAGPDYIPCLDNIQAIRKLRSRSHYEHLERHCPGEAPTCLVPLPNGYRTPIRWPKSRDMIWFANVPHTRLAQYKRDQNWVKVYGRYTTFPGGGTQFKHGAAHYIDFIQKTLSDIAWGKRSRVILDVGCGVASFGGYLFERDILTMSLAPKDVHEAQVQFALERGIPAILAVMGSNRLPFPSMVFDIVHCARCRVPWHIEGGRLLLELDRVLRPGGYFVWSATPVYRRNAEDVSIWKAMSKLTESMCWELVKLGKDEVNRVSAAIFRKPTSNDCYERRPKNDPPLCEDSDDPNLAWYTPLQPCIHKVPTDPSVRGSQWPAHWPSRLEKPPYWLKTSEVGASPKGFTDDYNRWKNLIANSYLNGMGIDWSTVRNVMDMRASYGGFAAALKDLKLWVMNVVPANSSDTLPIIYERGLFGLYHDWCESFNTYPRSYDLLHADGLFFDLKKRCNLVTVIAEVDRILRPGGRLIVRDDAETLSEVWNIGKSLHWKIRYIHLKDNESLLCVEKTFWRPSEVETIAAAIA